MAESKRSAVAEERLQKAFALFAEGKSVNAVGAAVYKNYWAAAKKAKHAWDVSQGRVVGDALGGGKVKAKKKKSVALQLAPAPEAADDDPYEVTIRIPGDRADDILAEFSEAEKMAAIQYVLQDRMDAALAAVAD